jgi:hypothetical protein
VLSDFLWHEIGIDNILPRDPRDELLLRKGSGDLDKEQVYSALGTWYAMRDIMPASMWRIY